MKPTRNQEPVAGFTLIEVIVVLAVVGFLASMYWPMLRTQGCRGKATRIRCTNNLKQVGIAFRLFQTDHNDLFPMQISVTNGGSREFGSGINLFRHFGAMSNELNTPKILLCPDDVRKAATNFAQFHNPNLSYFLVLTANPATPAQLLVGDRNVTYRNNQPPEGSVLPLLTNANFVKDLGWSDKIHQHAGNASLADGSVQNLSPARLREQVRHGGTGCDRAALP
jgi:prepilin-type N-terminal cleavage/methylation domain-containing protein